MHRVGWTPQARKKPRPQWECVAGVFIWYACGSFSQSATGVCYRPSSSAASANRAAIAARRGNARCIGFKRNRFIAARVFGPMGTIGCVADNET